MHTYNLKMFMSMCQATSLDMGIGILIRCSCEPLHATEVDWTMPRWPRLLFSCFCQSTLKLEMIGDHLQLQPSIMQKFAFERVNSVNAALFEAQGELSIDPIGQ